MNTYLKKLNKKIKFFITEKGLGKFEQSNQSIALNVLFSSQNSEEIALLYKPEHNCNRENNAVLLMINNDEKYYYFAVKIKLELYSSEWLRSQKESITKEGNCF